MTKAPTSPSKAKPSAKPKPKPKPSAPFWLLTGEARLGASSLLRAVSLPLALKLGAGAHTAVAATRSACSGATLWPPLKGPSGAGRSSGSEYRAVAGRVRCFRNKSKHSTHTPARLQLLLVVFPPAVPPLHGGLVLGLLNNRLVQPRPVGTGLAGLLGFARLYFGPMASLSSCLCADACLNARPMARSMACLSSCLFACLYFS